MASSSTLAPSVFTDERAQPVAPILVLDAERGGLDDLGVTADEVLDSAGKTFSPPDTIISSSAAAHVEQVVLVEVADIAG
jgi:hypothetical protein